MLVDPDSYWGMNGFFKIIRGINNLGIESDCAFMEPDISDEELVWEEKLVYGGSIFGMVPFSDTAKDHPIEDTVDVTSIIKPSAATATVATVTSATTTAITTTTTTSIAAAADDSGAHHQAPPQATRASLPRYPIEVAHFCFSVV